MTETLTGMTSMPKEAKKTVVPGGVERAAVRQLVRAARARGEDLTGPEGLLKMIRATVLEAALEEEMTEHLGHSKHDKPAEGDPPTLPPPPTSYRPPSPSPPAITPTPQS